VLYFTAKGSRSPDVSAIPETIERLPKTADGCNIGDLVNIRSRRWSAEGQLGTTQGGRITAHATKTSVNLIASSLLEQRYHGAAGAAAGRQDINSPRRLLNESCDARTTCHGCHFLHTGHHPTDAKVDQHLQPVRGLRVRSKAQWKGIVPP
jgi:hypothetical protein